MYIKKILIFLSVCLAIVFSYFCYVIYDAVFGKNTNFNTPNKEIFISKKDNIDSLILKIQPYVKDVYTFKEVAKRKKYKPKSGCYILVKGMNNNEMINTLRVQNTPVNVTFNNAENIYELCGKLANQLDDDSLVFVNALTRKIFLNDKGVTTQQSLAFYIPNTYQFYWDTDATKVRDKLLEQYESFWNTSREEKRKRIPLTRLEVIVLASIVQKETTKVDERPTVAGVYINRLRKDMKLQADPTIIHALKQKYNNPDTIIKRVLYKDLTIESPFNTYKYHGLPPAPIIMPDVSSIDAVLNYKKHEYLYFVASTTNIGYHIFAKTLRQHNRNARLYRRWVNAQNIFR